MKRVVAFSPPRPLLAFDPSGLKVHKIVLRANGPNPKAPDRFRLHASVTMDRAHPTQLTGRLATALSELISTSLGIPGLRVKPAGVAFASSLEKPKLLLDVPKASRQLLARHTRVEEPSRLRLKAG